MVLSDYWAKTSPFQSVLTHGHISGRVAQILLDNYISDGVKAVLQDELQIDYPLLRDYLGYLISLHDIGKIEYRFQAQNAEMREKLDLDPKSSKALFISGVRHEKTGQECLKELWHGFGEDRRLSNLFSKIVGAHHPSKKGTGNYIRGTQWAIEQASFEVIMRQLFLDGRQHALATTVINNKGVLGATILALLILSDWISSGPAFSDAEKWIKEPDVEKRIVNRTREFLIRSEMQPTDYCWPDRFSEIWTKIPADGLRSLQKETETIFEKSIDKYSLLLLEAPMGEGKTEAGIYAALQMAKQWGKSGFYLALPTSATANQMVGRMRDLIKQHGLDDRVRLLHSMAWLNETDDYQNGSEDETDGIANWLVPVRRGLLGQYAVGTIDQAMLAATTARYGVLRLLGLSNKVLIIDEIHSYDAYMNEIIDRLLLWCKALDVPVVMLSATLPPDKKQELFSSYTTQSLSNSYPLITAIRADGTVCEHIVPETTHRLTAKISMLPYLNETDLIAKTAAEMSQDGGCLCVLMNTVKEAQDVYIALKQRYSGDSLLFHAQFTAQRRTEIEKECIRRYGKDKAHRPKRSILVATQVVEQSLDVDFDTMITAVSPIDLLVQRLGRVHRHEGTERPVVFQEASMYVLTPKNGQNYGSSAYVYPECLLESSMRILSGVNQIRIPEDIAQIVRDGYTPELAPPDKIREWSEHLIKNQVEAGAAQRYLINEPDKQYNALIDDLVFDDTDGILSAATRLSEPTVRIAFADDFLLSQLKPYLKEKTDGTIFAEVWNKEIAEKVMLQSVSIRSKRFNRELSGLSYIFGGKLLSNTRIIHVVDGCCHLENGRKLCNDLELGIRIEEGKV